jgi:ribonuclease PH
LKSKGQQRKLPLTPNELNALLDLGEHGIAQLIAAQKAALAEG